MGFFAEAVRGYRAGRAARGAPPDEQPSDEQPSDSSGDRSADDMGWLREENDRIRAQLTLMQAESVRDRKQMRELESILAFPGARTALVKALHPDTGSGGSTKARTEIFQTLMAVMERLGIRG
jgi:hypothetical protein